MMQNALLGLRRTLCQPSGLQHRGLGRWWYAERHWRAHLSSRLAAALAAAVALAGAGVARADGANFGCKPEQALGAWLSCDAKGRLVAKTDSSTGAGIIDFSAAGYASGARELPWVPVAITLRPSGHDDTKAIQEALAKVAEMKPDARGLRGKVLLGPGTFLVSDTLSLAGSGVVLEGTASAGPNVTTLRFAGQAKLLFAIGALKGAKVVGNKVAVPSGLPSGTATLSGLKNHGFKAGESVRLSVARNEDWIKTMWGGTYPPVRDGAKQSAWGTTLTTNVTKTIASTTPSSVAFTSPLTDAIPADKYLTGAKATLTALDTSAYASEVGIAHLRAEGRFIAGLVDAKVLLTMAKLDNVEDAWLDDIVAVDFGMSFVLLNNEARRVTVQDLLMQRTNIQEGGAKPFDISIYGSEILVQASRSVGDKSFYIASQSTSPGPNVGFNLRFDGSGTVEPHQRWATGLLLDNVSVPKGGIALVDRGSGGSGQGWAAGFSVVYNCVAGTTPPKGGQGMDQPPGFTINQPPLSANWGVGLVGPISSKTKGSPHVVAGKAPLPLPSLFAQQRYQRLGAQGLATLLGPYRITDQAGQKCLSVAHAAAKEPAALATCSPGVLWEVTSRGGVRLAGSELCLDTGAPAAGSGVTLQPCTGGASQSFFLPARDGSPQAFMQKPVGRGAPMCLSTASKPELVPCHGNNSDFRLELSSLANTGD